MWSPEQHIAIIMKDAKMNIVGIINDLASNSTRAS